MLAGGEVIFQGETGQLLGAANGQVWTPDTLEPAPAGEITVVSALNIGGGMRYRVVLSEPPASGARASEPTLEDGYVALMHRHKLPARIA